MMFSRFIRRATVPAVGTMLYLHQQSRNNTPLFTQSTDFAQPKALKQKLSANRPNDWTHVHYAVQVYQDNGGILLNKEGWELIAIHQEKENSYFGAAYLNKKKQHIIIAHRGTEDFKDWLCDFDTIIHHLNKQQISAWDEFAKKIVETHGPDYTYSFTGHSLGGWLAELCLWKYQDEFVKDKFPAYQDGFSVTLDDPGGKELLDALQPRTEKSYKLALNKLDRTNYVSRPHTINTALGHDGSTIYALLPEVKFSWFTYYTPFFTAKMHSSAMLLKEFVEATGLPKHCNRVLDWPRVVWGKTLSTGEQGIFGYLAHAIKSYLAGDIQRGEYLGFYSYSTEAVNNPQTLPPASKFKLQHGIHYRTVAYQPEILPLRNMPTVARQFLEDLSAYPDRAKVITELMGSPVNPAFAHSLNAYRINEQEECVLNPQTSALTFREEVLGFLTKNPIFYQTKLAILREEYILKQATGGTPKLLESLNEQVQRSQELVFKLSFDQGTARLYKFTKPTWDEIKDIEEEHFALKKQLTTVQSLKLSLQASVLEPAIKTKANALLEQHEQQLQIAEQSAAILTHYLKDKPTEAESHTDQLIGKLQTPNVNLPDLDKNLLLNRAYNLKAKIAARLGNLALAQKYYQQAERLSPQDTLTQSNYGGLLTDLGRSTQEPKHYVEAYRCFQKVYPCLQQVKPTERPVVSSGMAYGFILLAQSLEQKSITESDISVQQLRVQAQSLLKEAISLNPRYANARLFLGLLAYDEKDYPRALQEINMTLTLEPMHLTALRRKGFILDKLEQPDEALSVLREAKHLLTNQGAKKNVDWLKEVDDKILEIETRLAKTRKPKL